MPDAPSTPDYVPFLGEWFSLMMFETSKQA